MAPPVPVTADSKVDAGPPAGDPREELELRLLLEAVFQLYGVVLLEEEGLYDRCQIYATDMNEGALQKAVSGAFPLAAMREHTSRYLAAGGRRSFSEYYAVRDGAAVFHPRLRRNVVFAQHNLVT